MLNAGSVIQRDLLSRLQDNFG